MSTRPTNAKGIFLEAVEHHAPNEWPQFLDRACGEDEELRRRVEVLLAAHDRGNRLLDASGPVATIEVPAASDLIGTSIGPYKLLQEIGEGGFGVVYMAEQNKPVNRKVALKIVKPGMDTREVIARFEAERQALAMMDHPNIARVLDAGTTAPTDGGYPGRPYFVMELVKGVPITQYADKNNLSTHERLQLFVTVCRAVQHAHQKGIIHRDIKPSNVMVTLHDGRPVVKVIDFGVSKALNQKLTEKTLFTAYGQMIGTPQYMSPEQAEMSGLDVDTRSDIYSLGVLLYELLTGTTPLDRKRLREAGYAEMQRLIQEEEPPRPSTRLSTLGDELTVIARHRSADPKQLRKAIHGELDWIVMKSLEKERGRRYESASSFAADVRRYLTNQAVEACPPSTAYRIHKFIHRNRGAVATAAALLLLLCAGVVGTTSGWIDAVRARRQIEDREREAVDARNAAVAAEGRAQEALRRANQETDRAVRAAADLRMRSYVSDIGLAYEAIQQGDLGYARSLLKGHRPEPNQQDLRGFEWRLLWGLSRGNYRADLGPYRAFLSGVAVSPDGQFAALHRNDPWRLEIIHLASGDVAKSIESGTDNPLMYSPSGRILIAGHQGKVVGLDTRSWKAREPLSVGFPLAFGHRTDREIFVAMADRDHLSVYSATDWQKIGDLANSPGAGELLVPGYGEREHMATTLAVSADDKTAYLASANGIRRWDLERRTELAPFHIEPSPAGPASRPNPTSPWGEGLSCVAASGDGQLAVGDRWGRVHLIDPDTGQVLHRFESHTGWVSSLKFAEDGTRLISAGADRQVVVYDPAKRSVVDRLLGHPSQIWGLDVSADGGIVASGSGDGGHVLTWSLVEPGGWALDRAGITRYSVQNDSRIAFLRDLPDDVEIYDPVKETVAPAHAERLVATLRETGAEGIAASPALKWLVTRGGAAATVWDVFAGSPVSRLPHESGDVRVARFSPDNRFLVTAGDDSEVRLWRTQTWTSNVLIEKSSVWDIGFSRDSRRVALSDRNRFVHVFDLPAAKAPQNIFEKKAIGVGGNSAEAFSIALSSEGRYLATGHQDAVIRIWDLDTMELIKTLDGHTAGIFSLSFSPDDRTLASASSSASMKLWHVPTWQRLLSVQADIRHLEFSPDGRYLAVNVIRSSSDILPGDRPGLRILKAPSLDNIDAALQ